MHHSLSQTSQPLARQCRTQLLMHSDTMCREVSFKRCSHIRFRKQNREQGMDCTCFDQRIRMDVEDVSLSQGRNQVNILLRSARLCRNEDTSLLRARLDKKMKYGTHKKQKEIASRYFSVSLPLTAQQQCCDVGGCQLL